MYLHPPQDSRPLLALSQSGWRNWLVAKLLGMPRTRSNDVKEFYRQFSDETQKRICYGMDRMNFLITGQVWGPGAEFARDILRLYRGESVEPDSAAVRFVEATWPRGECWL